MSRPVLIAIDGRNLTHPLSGNSSYIIAAINALSGLRPDWNFCFLTNRRLHPGCEERLNMGGNLQHICQGYTNKGLLWYCTELPLILGGLRPDFFWAPATLLPPYTPSGIKTIVTVNDLVPKGYRATMARFNRLYSDLMFDRSIRNADLLLAISQYTARAVADGYPVRRSAHIEVGCAIDGSVFMPLGLSAAECRNIAARYGIKPPFLLFVGTLEPRKNIDFMLELLPGLAKEQLSLLVVGAKGWGESRIAQVVNAPDFPSDRIAFAGHLPTNELVRLYNAAAGYISTSLNEGFGLPQLEAMHCGCPVVSPHNSAMIEVVEGGGITVKGWQHKDWLEAIRGITGSRDRYRESGFARAARYDWQKVATAIATQIEKFI